MLGRAHRRPLDRPQPTPHSQPLHTPAARSDTTPNTAAENLSAKGRISRRPAGGSGRKRPQSPRQTPPVRSIGLGIEGEEGLEAGAEAGAEAAADGMQVFSDEETWDVLEDIPNDSAAALLLLEHHWAVPLRDAIARGVRLSDGFISPLDLVAIGLMEAEEAKDLHAMETATAGTKQ